MDYSVVIEMLETSNIGRRYNVYLFMQTVLFSALKIEILQTNKIIPDVTCRFLSTTTTTVMAATTTQTAMIPTTTTIVVVSQTVS